MFIRRQLQAENREVNMVKPASKASLFSFFLYLLPSPYASLSFSFSYMLSLSCMFISLVYQSVFSLL